MKRTLKAIFAAFVAAAMLTAVSCANKTDDMPVFENETEQNDLQQVPSDDENAGEENTDTENEQPENLPTDPVKVEVDVVYEYINVTRNVKPDTEGLDFGDEFTSSFSVPQLAVDSDNAESFNQKLRAVYPDLAFEAKFSDEPVPTPCIYNYSYIYDVTDRGYVAIVITEGLGFYYSEGYTSHTCLYYDLKNDCEATAEEYLESAGIDDEKLKENTKKLFYQLAAKGELDDVSYDLSHINEYPEIGEVAIRSENEGYITVNISGYVGYYFIDVPVDEIVFEKAVCLPGTSVYSTPSFEDSRTLAIFEDSTELSVITKAQLPEYMQTVEFDESFEWYAVEYDGICGYVLATDIVMG